MQTLEPLEQLTLLFLVIVSGPSIFGAGFIFWVYQYRSKRHGTKASWLLKMLTVSSTALTFVLIYFSTASANRLLGFPPFPAALGVIAVGILGTIVPYKAVRLLLAMIEDDQPTVPTTNIVNGKINDRPQ